MTLIYTYIYYILPEKSVFYMFYDDCVIKV